MLKISYKAQSPLLVYSTKLQCSICTEVYVTLIRDGSVGLHKTNSFRILLLPLFLVTTIAILCQIITCYGFARIVI